MITLIVNNTKLNFEHSLVSLSEWEAELEKPFFSNGKGEKREESEWMKYFECMLIGESREYPHLIQLLDIDQKLLLINYMQKDRTGTTINEIKKPRGRQENVTSELIYYWLVTFKIPFQPTETWHLNRILMLVKICSIKQAPPSKNKQSRASLAQNMREINEQRRRESGTRG